MSYSVEPKRAGYSDTELEAITVCVNYADFLEEVLPHNLPHLDRLVVVTSHQDRATRELCRKWSVECIPTDAFFEKGEAFNKGHAINVGLGALRQRGWILQLDADVALPVTFRNMLAKSGLRRDCIYGVERCSVVGWRGWRRLQAEWHRTPQFSYHYLVASPAETPMGAQVVHKQFGWVPIGFFQMWHSEYMHQQDIRYPDTEGNAENVDVQWALRWPRRQRLLLPTVRVFHLESEGAPMGANWNGRVTKLFGPEP
jgi:hypothetical protein